MDAHKSRGSDPSGYRPEARTRTSHHRYRHQRPSLLRTHAEFPAQAPRQPFPCRRSRPRQTGLSRPPDRPGHRPRDGCFAGWACEHRHHHHQIPVRDSHTQDGRLRHSPDLAATDDAGSCLQARPMTGRHGDTKQYFHYRSYARRGCGQFRRPSLRRTRSYAGTSFSPLASFKTLTFKWNSIHPSFCYGSNRNQIGSNLARCFFHNPN